MRLRPSTLFTASVLIGRILCLTAVLILGLVHCIHVAAWLFGSAVYIEVYGGWVNVDVETPDMGAMGGVSSWDVHVVAGGSPSIQMDSFSLPFVSAEAQLPLAPPMIAIIVAWSVVELLLLEKRRANKRRYRMSDKCPHCEYDLTAIPNSHRCPECGTRRVT